MVWPCSQCTFENRDSSTSCEICNANRGSAPRLPDIRVPTSASSTPWACTHCTYVNVALAQMCAICGSARGSPPIATAVGDDDDAKRIDVDDASSLSTPVVATRPTQPRIDPEVARRKLEEAAAREAERIERERIASERQREERKKEIERRRQELSEEKKEIEKRRLQERLEIAKSRRESQARQEDEMRRLRERRAEFENQVKDIPSAVKMIRDRYGMDVLLDVFNIVSKIVRRIIESPNDEKIRTLKVSSPMYKSRIGCRLGAVSFILALGFERRTVESGIDEQEEILFMPTVDVPKLKAELAKMVAVLDRPETKLRDLVGDSDAGADENIPLLFLMTFRKILDNILIAPSSSIARKIDMRSDSFNAHFKPFPPAVSILQEFGFEQKDHIWEFQGKSLQKLQKCIRDVDKLIAQIMPRSSIVRTLEYVFQHNSFSAVSATVDKFISVLTNVVNDQHQTKHHQIPLFPFFKLSGPVDGAREFITALGFDVNPELSTARVPYPYQHGVETFKLTLEILQLKWKRLLKSARHQKP